MIQLRMARLTLIQPASAPSIPGLDSTPLAFRYLYTFRRIVVGLALIGAIVAFVEGWTGLAATFLTIGVGELLETSYYLNVLRWRQRQRSRPGSA